MHKAQSHRVQALPRKPRNGLFCAVHRIPVDGMADIGHVDPYLVGPPGLQTAADVGVPREALQHLPVGDGPLPAPVRDGHLFPVCAVPPDGSVHGARLFPEAPRYDALVGPGQGMILELGGKGLMGGIVLGGDDEAAGVPVDAVDDPRAQGAPHAAEAVPAVVQQGVDQGAVRMPRSRMDHQPRRLVDHDHVPVLIGHVQRDLLWQGLNGLRLREGGLHRLPAVEPGALGSGPAVHRHLPRLDEPGGGGPGQFWQGRGQEAVQTDASALTGDRQAYRFHRPSPPGAFPSAHSACRGAAGSRRQSRWCRTPPGCPPH